MSDSSPLGSYQLPPTSPIVRYFCPLHVNNAKRRQNNQAHKHRMPYKTVCWLKEGTPLLTQMYRVQIWHGMGYIWDTVNSTKPADGSPLMIHYAQNHAKLG